MVSGYCHQNISALSSYPLFEQIPFEIIHLCFEYFYHFEGTFKCIFVGESNVGKTSIIRRFVQGRFEEYAHCTIAAAFCKKSLEMNGCQINYEIWDSYSGRFQWPSPMYFRGAKVAIAVFDITAKDSFEKLKEWIAKCKESTYENEMMIAVAANKCDLHSICQVNMDEVREYTQEQDCVLFETSAKEDVNITEMFEEMGQRAADKTMNLDCENGLSFEEEPERNQSFFSCWW